MPSASKSPSGAAAALIADRGQVYGSAGKNFQRIADLWNAILGDRFDDEVDQLTVADVAQMIRLVKESRLAESPDHFDSLADICAYADLQHEILNPVKLYPDSTVNLLALRASKPKAEKETLAYSPITNDAKLYSGEQVLLRDGSGVWRIEEMLLEDGSVYRVAPAASVSGEPAMNKLIHRSDILGVV